MKEEPWQIHHLHVIAETMVQNISVCTLLLCRLPASKHFTLIFTQVFAMIPPTTFTVKTCFILPSCLFLPLKCAPSYLSVTDSTHSTAMERTRETKESRGRQKIVSSIKFKDINFSYSFLAQSRQ